MNHRPTSDPHVGCAVLHADGQGNPTPCLSEQHESVALGRPPMTFYEVRTCHGEAYRAEGDVIEQGDGWFTLWADDLTIALRIPEADIRAIRRVNEEDEDAVREALDGGPEAKPGTSDDDEGHPEQPPDRTDEEVLRDQLYATQTALRRISEALGTEVAEVPASLRRPRWKEATP